MIAKFKSQKPKFKNLSARIYTMLLITVIVALFDVFTAIILFILLVIVNYIYVFLKYVMLFGSLNEDLREINN